MDFHTSEAIAGVGGDFDADRFADTLAEAHVDSVTCFARCHHGWLYYNSKLFPQRIHPHLANRSLLKQQIDACHKRNIRVPIYITVQWDHYTANLRPDWLMMTHEGKVLGTPPYEAGFYKYLCVNSPYVEEFLKPHVREVLTSLPTDGLFFDIVQVQPCSCRWCRQGMIDAGMDPSDAAQRQAYFTGVIGRFEADMTRFVRRLNKDCTIFYNAGHIGPRHRTAGKAYSHFELESLPSGGWGYLHFPLTVRYARNLGPDVLGMTGKFHTSWGDFHSYKNRPALAFECFSMLAHTAKCSIGDQLHPSGAIDGPTYELVGSVYRDVAAREPWCAGARPVTEIGVMTPEEFRPGDHTGLPAAMMGATRLLQEGLHQFDVIDSASDLGRYSLVILPDDVPVAPALAARLKAYMKAGGSLIASHRSGLAPDGGDFALKELGVKLVGEAPYSPDFLVPRGPIGRGLPRAEHVMYMRGLHARPNGATVLADVAVPYFNRTWEHFCSHRHTPSARKVGYGGIFRQGQAIYFAHPVFAQYNRNAPRWCKQLVLNAIDMLIGRGLVEAVAPTTLIATLNEQRRLRRRVLHLLHYVPERRGGDFDIIEDEIPLHDVRISVRCEKPPRSIRTAPDGTALQFAFVDGRAEFTVPRIVGHQMVELAL
jgi:hypothetical protein